MSTVLAKFYIAEVHKTSYGNQAAAGSGAVTTGKVILRAATRGDANADWSNATPAGTFEMTVNNPAAFAAFDAAVGQDVAITMEIGTPVVNGVHPFRPTKYHPGQAWPGPDMCGDCGGSAGGPSHDVPTGIKDRVVSASNG